MYFFIKMGVSLAFRYLVLSCSWIFQLLELEEESSIMNHVIKFSRSYVFCP